MSAAVSYKHNNPEFEVETVNSTTPLMGDKKNQKPTLATPEIDDQDDDREVVKEPYPGVDDGFFDNEKPADSEVPKDRNNVPKTERGEKPEIESNHDRDHKTEPPEDENDGASTRRRHSGSIPPHFPRESDFSGHHHHEVDIGTGILLEDIPDLNVYQHKKTLAQGMMDLALFSANANQLRYVLDSFDRHPYYFPSLIFITISLILQVAIGVLLIWNATYNVKDEKEVCRANKINNYTVIGIFLVTVVNVFVSAFGVADAPSSVVNTPIPGNTT